MIRLTKLRKAIAMFFLINIVFEIVAPHVSYALTAGPTAPEATSFEPVDTTDMVNLQSGDFTYNVPLLEVPGPEGGYPLSLSYHAGIQPNEESSWVGLGWTLNPGAITRNVNGYPDDHNGALHSRRDYWAGGSTTTYSIGLTAGFMQSPASVSFNLAYSKDTYKGVGLGFSGSVGGNYGPIALGLSIGMGPYDSNPSINGKMGINASFGIGDVIGEGVSKALQLNASTGITTNFKSVGGYSDVGLNYKSGSGSKAMTHSLVGFSIASGSSKPSLSIGGASVSIHNNNAGKIQTESSGFSIGIPISPAISIGVGYSHVRYWSDEKDNVATYGDLYGLQPKVEEDYKWAGSKVAYDNYDLLDPLNENTIENPEAERHLGGTFPNTDNYSVSAQGLSGEMRPYSYQRVLYRQKKYVYNEDWGGYLVYVSNYKLNSTGGNFPQKAQFRFVNDFSNKYQQPTPDFEQVTDGTGLKYVFGTGVYGDNDGSFGYQNDKLLGSKNIEWFTNLEIQSGYAKGKGFISPENKNGFVRDISSELMAYQVGGFMITNESGVTYHYGLPAYGKDEYIESRKKDGTSRNELHKKEKYAYTWYLTGITGPDYVDRNNNGFLDVGDWGYWVNFEYGKWADNYKWRNPSEGAHQDLDVDFENYSEGYKELYYLNSVNTRTHTALFEKEIKYDGKSADNNYVISYNIYGYSFPVSTLRLNKIFILNNKDLVENLASKSAVYDDYLDQKLIHLGKNVVDKYDVDIYRSQLTNSAIRVIDFNYDYSLCPYTKNSFGTKAADYDIYSSNPDLNQTIEGTGKLTLKSLDFKGKMGATVTPPLKFEYDLENTIENQVQFSLSSNDPTNSTIICGAAAQVGDIIKTVISNKPYWFLIANKESDTQFKIQYLKDKLPTISGTINGVKTKNPPYDKDKVDLWGLYKSDYIKSNNEMLSRVTSVVSSKATDVWSLRAVSTTIGAKISVNYESDEYAKIGVPVQSSFTVKSITKVDANRFKIQIDNQGIALDPNLTIGSQLPILILLKNQIMLGIYFPFIVDNRYSNKPTVVSIDNDEITLESSSMVTSLFDPQRKFVGGNIFIGKSILKPGGGLRTQNITVSDFLKGTSLQTSYEYKLLDSTKQSSGITSYEPSTMPIYSLNTTDFRYIKEYKKALYKDLYYLLHIAREIPAPGVMYEYVTVKENVINPSGEIKEHKGKAVYQFQTFKANQIGIKEINNSYKPLDFFYTDNGNESEGVGPRTHVNGMYSRNISLKDLTAQIGNLKRVVRYDDNDNKIAETINHYVGDGLENLSFENNSSVYLKRLSKFNHQGLIQERFANARRIMPKEEDNKEYVIRTVMAQKETYPNIITGSTTINYKTGVKEETKNLAFDFYSGQITKKITVDEYGNRFLNETIPAYRIDEYNKMGSKGKDIDNKNMLSQVAANYVYKVDDNNNLIGLVSGTVNTWSNETMVQDPDGLQLVGGQPSVWRSKSKYNWLYKGNTINGITPLTSFKDFFKDGKSNEAWTKTSEITLYNVYSNALEATDINNVYSATKMGYNSSKVIVSGGPAKYNEIAFSGAEDTPDANGKFGGNVEKADGILTTAFAHTGRNSLKIGQGKQCFLYNISTDKLTTGLDYIAKVWVRNESGSVPNASLFYRINGGLATYVNASGKKAGNWSLIELKIPKSQLTAVTTLQVGCINNFSENVYVDDFRFQPLEALTTAYVYDQLSGELNYIIDNNNLFTRYEYDAAGKLTKTYKESLNYAEKLIGELGYNYAMSRSPHWVVTGNNRCQGDFAEMEKKDINSLSPTFNTTKWEPLNIGCLDVTSCFVYSAYPADQSIIFKSISTGKELRYSIPASSGGGTTRTEFLVPADICDVSVLSNSVISSYKVTIGSFTPQPIPAYFNHADMRTNSTITITNY